MDEPTTKISIMIWIISLLEGITILIVLPPRLVNSWKSETILYSALYIALMSWVAFGFPIFEALLVVTVIGITMLLLTRLRTKG